MYTTVFLMIFLFLFGSTNGCYADNPSGSGQDTLSTAKPSFVLHHPKDVVRVEFSPDSSELLTTEGGNGVSRVWDIQKKTIVKEFGEFHIPIKYSPKNGYISARTTRGDQGLLLYNSSENKGYRWFPTGVPFLELEFSRNEKYVAVGGGFSATTALWRVGEGLSSQRLLRGKSAVEAISFSPNNYLVAVGHFNGAILIWNAYTGILVNEVRIHTQKSKSSSSTTNFISSPGLFDLEFTGSANLIAVAGSDRVVLVDIRKNEVIRAFENNGEIVSNISLSPSGSLLAGGTDSLIKIWNVDSGKLVANLHGHTKSVRDVTFSQDGKLLASAGGEDGTVRIWDVSEFTK